MLILYLTCLGSRSKFLSIIFKFCSRSHHHIYSCLKLLRSSLEYGAQCVFHRISIGFVTGYVSNLNYKYTGTAIITWLWLFYILITCFGIMTSFQQKTNASFYVCLEFRPQDKWYSPYFKEYCISKVFQQSAIFYRKLKTFTSGLQPAFWRQPIKKACFTVIKTNQ